MKRQLSINTNEEENESMCRRVSPKINMDQDISHIRNRAGFVVVVVVINQTIKKEKLMNFANLAQFNSLN